MHLGIFALVGETRPKNFTHFIFNNGTHESVGGQPVASPSLDYKKLANVCGYRYSGKANNLEELRRELDAVDLIDGPSLIEVSINSQSRNDLSRPKNTPLENKIKFKEYIRTGQ
jgi:phosphonopyruvate decarboxylase